MPPFVPFQEVDKKNNIFARRKTNLSNYKDSHKDVYKGPDEETKFLTNEQYNKLRSAGNLKLTDSDTVRLYRIIDNRYEFTDSYYEEKYDEEDVSFIEEKLIESIDEGRINPKYFSERIIASANNKFDGINIEEEQKIISSLKAKVMSDLLGNGNPFNCKLTSLLDQEAYKKDIYKYDDGKIADFLNKANQELNKDYARKYHVNASKSLSEYAKYDANPHEDILYALDQDYLAQNGGSLASGSSNKNLSYQQYLVKDPLNKITNRINSGEYNLPSTDTLHKVARSYFQLEGKINAMPGSLKNEENYTEKKAQLESIKKFLTDGCKLPLSALKNSQEMDNALENYDKLKQSPYSRFELVNDNLAKASQEYNKHNFFWKVFMGGSLRDQISKSSNQLMSMGFSKDYVDFVKSKGNSQEAISDAYNKIVDSYNNSKTQAENCQTTALSLNYLKSISKDQEFKVTSSQAISMLVNDKSSSIENKEYFTNNLELNLQQVKVEDEDKVINDSEFDKKIDKDFDQKEENNEIDGKDQEFDNLEETLNK